MRQKIIALLIFLSVLLVASVIILASLNDYYKNQPLKEQPKNLKKPSLISAKVVSNPCQFPKCYYPQGESFCHEQGKNIETTTTDLKNEKICIQKESLTCNQGRWVFSKYPEKFC